MLHMNEKEILFLCFSGLRNTLPENNVPEIMKPQTICKCNYSLLEMLQNQGFLGIIIILSINKLDFSLLLSLPISSGKTLNWLASHMQSIRKLGCLPKYM